MSARPSGVGAGNIAVHAFRREFLERVGGGDLALPYHRARKKLVALDERGTPREVEGIKFETFVFDALPRAERVLVQEVLREEEFVFGQHHTWQTPIRTIETRSGVRFGDLASIDPLADVVEGPEATAPLTDFGAIVFRRR